MIRIAGGVLAIAIAQGALAVVASAQTRPAAQRPKFEVSFGGLWIGGAQLGSTTAELRANSLTPTPFRLFSTDTRAAAAPGLDARVTYWLTRTIGVEGGFVRVRPELRTLISSDAEGAASLTVAERLDQYFIDANVIWALEPLRIRRRTLPFLSAGAGYLRQLHEGRTLVVTGQVYEFGGGVRHHLVDDVLWFRAIGLRADGRIYVLVDGVQLEDHPRTHGAFSGAVVFTF